MDTIEATQAEPSSSTSWGMRALLHDLAPWVSGLVVLLLAAGHRWDLVSKFLSFGQ